MEIVRVVVVAVVDVDVVVVVVVVVVIVVVVIDDVDVITLLSHGYNAVRGHRTGSNNSGAEDYLRRKTSIIYTITETKRIPQTKQIVPGTALRA